MLIINIIFFTRLYSFKPVIERVEESGTTVYRITNTAGVSIQSIMLMDLALAFMLLISVFLVIYLGKTVVKPFTSMTNLTEELAKGNLAAPVKAEKNKYLGRFLWGIDMLRDNLESNKEKELELQKEKKTLILSISHDIKTPLSAIELYTRALKTGLYDSKEEQEQVYEGIESNIAQIKEYVSEIVTASREDFLNLSVRDTECYLSEVVDKIAGYYSEKLGHLHTQFVIADYSNCILKADPDRLVEVMQNIIENAIKYGDGRQITIAFSEEEDCQLIHISNTGTKPAKEEVANLFDSFYRGSNVKSAKGSGLGLYICRQLMHLMSGEVYLDEAALDFTMVIVVQRA